MMYSFNCRLEPKLGTTDSLSWRSIQFEKRKFVLITDYSFFRGTAIKANILIFSPTLNRVTYISSPVDDRIVYLKYELSRN